MVDAKVNNFISAWIHYAVVLVVSLIVYSPALNGGFVWDDAAWTTDLSALLSNISGLRDMWMIPTSLQQYFPLTGTSFWIDYNCWGWWTFPYHIENVLLHVLSSILFWHLLRKLAIPSASFAALVFALHPMMVESVAWITERKNVLSMPLFLGSLLAYIKYTSNWNFEAKRERQFNGVYFLSLVLFLLALLAKVTAYVLPPTLLLLCWWKRGNLRWKNDVLPTLPFFAIALVLCYEINWLEKHHVGAMGAEFSRSLSQRFITAGHAFWFYPGKLLWPSNLCFIYTQWKVDVSDLEQWIWPISACLALILPWFGRARIGRGPVIAIWFYAGAIFPSLGFLDVYALRFLDVWDHWFYLPSLSLIVLGVGILGKFTQWLSVVLKRFMAVALLSVLGLLTSRQAVQFQSMERLWLTTIEKNPSCWMAHHNLGLDLEIGGHLEEAIKHYKLALALRPERAEFHNNLGTALSQLGKFEEATSYYQKALEIEPENAQLHSNMASLLIQTGRIKEAIGHLQSASKLRPDFIEFHKDLANALLKDGRTDEALTELQAALMINSKDAEAQVNLGNIYIKLKKAELAKQHYQIALDTRPDDSEVHNNLGWALQKTGRCEEAVRHYYAAVRLNPKYALAHKNLAWVLATSPEAGVRDASSAMIHAKEASRLDDGSDTTIVITLAAAQAAESNFSEAITTANKALSLAEKQGKETTIKAIQAQIKIYEAGYPMRDPSLRSSSD
jgi:tetratricopeptide (TPR) repeat protein